MTTDVVRTEQPVLTDGISSVAFFNGRLLTGEDLTREQLATTEARLRVGRALGSGVVCGLGVSLKASTDLNRPVLTVQPGRAVNVRGAVMELSSGVDVALTRESATGSGPEAIFTDCRPLQPGTYIAGVGAYVLTVEPARRGVGRAPVSGLQNAQAQCNVAYSLEGVQFTLLRVALPAGVVADPDRTRNRVAHLHGRYVEHGAGGRHGRPAGAEPAALRDARRAGGPGLPHRRPGAPRLPAVDRLAVGCSSSTRGR